jgi:hypothetical protein
LLLFAKAGMAVTHISATTATTKNIFLNNSVPSFTKGQGDYLRRSPKGRLLTRLYLLASVLPPPSFDKGGPQRSAL